MIKYCHIEILSLTRAHRTNNLVGSNQGSSVTIETATLSKSRQDLEGVFDILLLVFVIMRADDKEALYIFYR